MNMQEDTLYCIDTSAFIDIHKFYSQKRYPDLWIELDRLCERDSIISHIIVFEELTTQAKRPSSLSKWVASRRRHFYNDTYTQATHVAKIINRFPGLIDPYSHKDQADPWLIALILEERDKPTLFAPNKNIIMVSQEDELSLQKIPAVCKHFDIKHINMFDFFDANGWKFSFTKPVSL